MHVYLPDLAARAVPRYTSYPTAAEFGGTIGAAEQAAALADIAPDRETSLYVHVPYCHEICWYCGCNTGPAGRGSRLDAYVAALEAEIALTGAAAGGRVISVHFGGGSPNALPPGGLTRIAAALRAAFRIDPAAEWAIELDPRSLTTAQADELGAIGFTRASLGVQTLAHRVQVAINRVQPMRLVSRGVADLRAAGIDRINIDLMYGLPGQTLDDIAATLAQTLVLEPDRIAMFGYAHLPRMLPRQRMIDEAALPDAQARFWQSALAHDLIVEAGYEAIGFDHFARPGDSLAQAGAEGRLRRNFQGFTDDPATVLIGLGASAISQFDGVMVQNEKHVGTWRMRVGNGLLAGVRGVRRTPDDRMRGAIIERLLCDGVVDLERETLRFGRSPLVLGDELLALDPFREQELVELTGWTLRLTPDARPYARLVATVFDAHRKEATRFSRAV